MSTHVSGRPATISELAEQARAHGDQRNSIKSYLRLADQLRRDGKDHAEQNDLEKAFVAYARAASIVLEKIPNHREYQEVLKPTQRNNLALNGQEMLDGLGELKPILVDRYEKWMKRHPDSSRASSVQPRPDQDMDRVTSDMQRLHADNNYQATREFERRLREEAEAARIQREDITRRQEADRRLHLPPSRPVESREAVTSARIAAGIVDHHSNASGSMPYPSQRSYHDDMSSQQYHQQQEAVKRREEAAHWHAHEEQRVPHDYSTSGYPPSTFPQATYNTPPITTTQAGIQMPSAQVAAPINNVSRSSSEYVDTSGKNSSSLLMPLESPTKYDGDSTDSEAFFNSHTYRRGSKNDYRIPTKQPNRSSSYPPPVTTTSPPPGGHIDYPQLMTQHQKKQGYVPSLNSMFTPSNPSQVINQASLLFEPSPDSKFTSSFNSQQLYSNILPQPSGAIPAPSAPERSHNHAHYPLSQPRYPTSQSRPPPAVPPPQLGPIEPERAVSRSNTFAPELKTVNLPRACLPRFLAIAKVNTAMNRETCGLLLGKPHKNNKYAVTTLLIPKQHSTSDTCTMDEEELVLMFTEERNLITLGWIHTHPSQSCFMSSVDLHTHSGFQQMLPESFAVVCAPQSNPNFGIFRLTDPPGLQAILDCKAKEAFHPHPDLPIYTDADKGHVVMKDLPLEIVDLR